MSSSAVPAWLVQWATSDGAKVLLAHARTQLEAGTRTGDRATVTVDLTPAERKDVGRVLGLTWQTSGKAVQLGALRAAMAQHGTTLPALLERTGGPLRDLKAQRDAARAAKRDEHTAARSALLEAGVPEPVADVVLVRRWLPDGAMTLLDAAASVGVVVRAVRERTHSGGERPLLATFASDLFADPHALDMGRQLGRAAARALAALDAHDAGGDTGTITDAGATACADSTTWRQVWDRAGVACDLVSSTVLALNVPAAGHGPAAAILRAAKSAGEPVWLTARALAHGAPPVAELHGMTVRVCENPAVVEAAATRYAAVCQPLVCTYGRPSSAAWLLLRQLTAAGARVLVSADRDTAGRSILEHLLTQLPGSQPWLPDVPGTYEEERLDALLADLAPCRGTQEILHDDWADWL